MGDRAEQANSTVPQQMAEEKRLRRQRLILAPHDLVADIARLIDLAASQYREARTSLDEVATHECHERADAGEMVEARMLSSIEQHQFAATFVRNRVAIPRGVVGVLRSVIKPADEFDACNAPCSQRPGQWLVRGAQDGDAFALHIPVHVVVGQVVEPLDKMGQRRSEIRRLVRRPLAPRCRGSRVVTHGMSSPMIAADPRDRDPSPARATALP